MVPALLTMADFYGTLAAVRGLGRAGVPLAVGASTRLAAARWSRYVDERFVCPPLDDPDTFMDWLLEHGRGPTRYALLATSDDTAWLFSRAQPELREHFDIHLPPVEVVYGLLNKRHLHQQCGEADIPVPRSWFPTTESELDACLREVRGATIIKPRSQILFQSGHKGALIEDPNHLKERFGTFAGYSHARALLDVDPDASQPMIQEFYEEAERATYNLTGYAGEDGEVWALRGGRKVLQLPRKAGVGVCFEDAPVIEEGAAAIQRLVERTGFFGVFEAEFIVAQDRLLLIDFNPRFYHQMAFDHDRGLPLALLAYYTAVGDQGALSRIRAHVEPRADHSQRTFVSRLTFELMLIAQRLSGALSPEDARTWREWSDRHRTHRTDPVWYRPDPLPAAVETVHQVFYHLRHLRGTYRTLVLNR